MHKKVLTKFLLGLLLFSCFIQQYTIRIIKIMTRIAPHIPPITPPIIAPELSTSSVDAPIELISLYIE